MNRRPLSKTNDENAYKLPKKKSSININTNSNSEREVKSKAASGEVGLMSEKFAKLLRDS